MMRIPEQWLNWKFTSSYAWRQRQLWRWHQWRLGEHCECEWINSTEAPPQESPPAQHGVSILNAPSIRGFLRGDVNQNTYSIGSSDPASLHGVLVFEVASYFKASSAFDWAVRSNFCLSARAPDILLCARTVFSRGIYLWDKQDIPAIQRKILERAANGTISWFLSNVHHGATKIIYLSKPI